MTTTQDIQEDKMMNWLRTSTLALQNQMAQEQKGYYQQLERNRQLEAENERLWGYCQALIVACEELTTDIHGMLDRHLPANNNERV